ncbi:MAG: hypothetical protein ABIE75_02455 [Candidatus Omnitrophota bacterium]
MKRIISDKKNLLILLLGILSLIAAQQAGLEFIIWILGGILACSLWDFLINKLFLKRKISFKSAIITGFIISGILDYHQSWLTLIILSLAAIGSKYILRFRKKHIFNPANFGLFLAAIFKLPLTWQIESNIYLIIIAGAYLAYSFKKIPQVISFLVFFGGLFSLIKINPLNLINWFFLSVMLIEPKTSGYGLVKGSIFGAVAAIACFLIYKFSLGTSLFITALVIANLFNIISDIIRINKSEVRNAA